MIYTATALEMPVAEDDEIARLRRRDPAALAGVVGRYQHRLYRYLARITRDPAAADDLFQQTWLHVVRQIGRYDPGRSFDTWLFAIAHNAAVDFLRRRGGESLDDVQRPLRTPEPDALAQAIASERAAILASRVSALPALYREALTLRFEEGLKLEEIAEVTRAPLATVKSRVRRALEHLRGSLAARWSKEDLL